MKLSKIIIGIVACLSLSGCSGSKVSREKFFLEVENIREDTLTKAKLTYNSYTKSGYGSDIEEEKEYGSGLYLKDADLDWQRGSDTNDSLADDIFTSMIRHINLLDTSEFDNSFEIKTTNGTSFTTIATKSEQNYYINPFSYDASVKDEFSASGFDEKITVIRECHYEWNDFGYLTYADVKDETIAETNNEKRTYIQQSTVKVVYR